MARRMKVPTNLLKTSPFWVAVGMTGLIAVGLTGSSLLAKDLPKPTVQSSGFTAPSQLPAKSARETTREIERLKQETEMLLSYESAEVEMEDADAYLLLGLQDDAGLQRRRDPFSPLEPPPGRMVQPEKPAHQEVHRSYKGKPAKVTAPGDRAGSRGQKPVTVSLVLPSGTQEISFAPGT